MSVFSSDVKTIVDQAKVAGVPVVATFLPNRAEADLLTMSPMPAGIVPGRRNGEVRAILTSNGATYIDVLPDLQETPNLDGLYDQLGYHLNAEGHAVLTQILARALTSGTVPALDSSQDSQMESSEGNR
jgi:hypothetical protein